MKLRIRDDSVRLRLTRSEVSQLKNSKRVQAKTRFGPGPRELLTYCLEIDRRVSEIQASLDGGMVCVKVPEKMGMHWASSDLVALRNEQKIDETSRLKILIEKDFFCLKPRQHEIEDESDLYPNPGSHSGTCQSL